MEKIADAFAVSYDDGGDLSGCDALGREKLAAANALIMPLFFCRIEIEVRAVAARYSPCCETAWCCLKDKEQNRVLLYVSHFNLFLYNINAMMAF